MKTEFTPEVIEKAKCAKSAAELMRLAKENGIELKEEEAAVYYATLCPQSGAVEDEELENVAGGGCKQPENTCYAPSPKQFTCEYCFHVNPLHLPERNDPKYFGQSKKIRCENCGYAYIVSWHPTGIRISASCDLLDR